MKDEDRQTLSRRWDELHRELDELLEGKVQPGNVDLAAREDEIHAELDRIEHALGLAYLDRVRRERSKP